MYGLQEAAHSGTADGHWPLAFDHLLGSVPNSQRRMAECFFSALLHPNPAERFTAAQAMEHSFVQEVHSTVKL